MLYIYATTQQRLQKYVNMRKLVIRPLYPGLGDHLIFSPVPRIAKKLGYDKVYITNSLEFRDPSLRHYIWECNPYIDGFKDSPPTFASALSCRRPWHEEWGLQDRNAIDNVLNAHGLNDNTLWHTPEVYFKTETYEKFKDAVVFDPNFVHLWRRIINPEEWKEKIKRWFLKNNVKIDYQITSDAYKGLYLDGLGEQIRCHDFIEYSSIVNSCKNFYCMGAGSAFLAVALGQHPVVFHLRQFRKKPGPPHGHLKENEKNHHSGVVSSNFLQVLHKKLCHDAKIKLKFHLTIPNTFRECTYITISSY